VSNAIEAHTFGATIVDGASMGLGAGAGNAQLENIVANFIKGNTLNFDLKNFIEMSKLVEVTHEEFLRRARKIHGNKYEYLERYKNNKLFAENRIEAMPLKGSIAYLIHTVSNWFAELKKDIISNFKPQAWIKFTEPVAETLEMPGIPKGHISLVRGHSNTGKTTLIVNVLSEYFGSENIGSMVSTKNFK
jgi:hypothetical protein